MSLLDRTPAFNMFGVSDLEGSSPDLLATLVARFQDAVEGETSPLLALYGKVKDPDSAATALDAFVNWGRQWLIQQGPLSVGMGRNGPIVYGPRGLDVPLIPSIDGSPMNNTGAADMITTNL